MAKKKIQVSYKCSECGFTQPKWLGRCPECGSWNTMEECIHDPNALSSVAPGNIAVKVPVVPEEAKEAVNMAIEGCPVEAISIVKEEENNTNAQ